MNSMHQEVNLDIDLTNCFLKDDVLSMALLESQ